MQFQQVCLSACTQASLQFLSVFQGNNLYLRFGEISLVFIRDLLRAAVRACDVSSSTNTSFASAPSLRRLTRLCSSEDSGTVLAGAAQPVSSMQTIPLRRPTEPLCVFFLTDKSYLLYSESAECAHMLCI